MVSLRTILNGIVVALLSATAIGMYLLANVDDYATQFTNDKLAEIFAESGLDVSVQEANFISGVGLELRDLQIVDLYRTQNESICFVDSIVVRFPTQMEELVSANIRPTALEIDGFKLLVDGNRLNDEFFERLKTIPPRLPPSQKLVPTRIRNSALVLRSIASTDITIDRLGGNFMPDVSAGKKELNFELQAHSNLARQIDVKGGFDLVQRQWHAEFTKVVLDLNEQLIQALPLPDRIDRSPFNGLIGKAAIRARVDSSLVDGQPRFVIRGRAIDISITNDRIPGIVRNTSIDFGADNHGFKINRLKGIFENGSFDLKYEQSGWATRQSWKTSGALKEFNFDERLGQLFSEECKKFCHDFSPSGSFDLQFALNSAGQKNITSQIKDMAFSFHKFPYRVEHCVGNVKWVDDILDFNVHAIQQGQLLEFGGRVNKPGKLATYRFDFGTDGLLPIDQKLMNSLQKFPSVDKSFRDLRPVGFVNGRGVVEKVVPGNSVVRRDIRIHFHDCRVRHRKFDYPMQDVAGSVHVTNDGFTFEDVSGRSSSGKAICNGSWDARSGLQLTFNCEGTQLDQHLRGALSPTIGEVWDGLRPEGRIESGRVFLNLPPGNEYADIRVVARLGNQNPNSKSNGIAVVPTWFPYRIHNLTGTVEIGDGQVRLENIAGKHGNAWVGFNGQGRYDEHQWSVNLQDLFAGQITPDDELLFALPVDLAKAIRQLEYQGSVNVSGAMAFAGRNEGVASNSTQNEVQLVNHVESIESVDVGWDVRLDMDQSKMQLGLPLENIFGFVRLKGTNLNSICECSGEVSIDSLTVYGMQVTNVQGPIWIDNNQTLAGKFARTSGNDGPSLVGEVFDGKISFDGWVSHEDQYPFRLQTVIEKSRLDELAAETAPEIDELSGDCYGLLQLNGNANEPHTYEGQGNLHLRNAKIHQLPVILSLLKILNIKEVNRTAFDSSNVDFSVKGNQLKLDRIELIGDAISLIGNGYLEMMRHADINFYSVVGRNRLHIPLISDLYRAGSQRIMWINMGGPLQNLQTTRKMLPGLDDSIRSLIRPGEFDSAPGN